MTQRSEGEDKEKIPELNYCENKLWIEGMGRNWWSRRKSNVPWITAQSLYKWWRVICTWNRKQYIIQEKNCLVIDQKLERFSMCMVDTTPTGWEKLENILMIEHWLAQHIEKERHMQVGNVWGGSLQRDINIFLKRSGKRNLLGKVQVSREVEWHLEFWLSLLSQIMQYCIQWVKDTGIKLKRVGFAWTVEMCVGRRLDFLFPANTLMLSKLYIEAENSAWQPWSWKQWAKCMSEVWMPESNHQYPAFACWVVWMLVARCARWRNDGNFT